MKKYRKIFIIVLIMILMISIVLFFRRTKDYVVTYEVDKFNISEGYIKDKSSYIFFTNYNDKLYDIVINNKYLHDKKIIDSVKLLENDDYSCIYFQSNKLELYPICYKGDDRVDYNIVSKDGDFFEYKNVINTSDEYKSIKINALLDKNIAVWNHYGYEYINKKSKQSIKLFQKESYYDNYSFQLDEYVLVPNYDESYYFTGINIINLKNGKVKLWNFNYEISYDFYVLGSYEDKVYIIDRKNRIEYSLCPKKESIEIISNSINGRIYNNSWEEVSLTKLVNNNYNFTYGKPIGYTLVDNKLYLNYFDNETKILITLNKVDRIVYSSSSEIAYISQDKLYYYSPYYGEVLMMEYSEWSFNEKDSVYIY